jgi:23S rRNA pseudouridine1911/1915/1917 synthase
MVNTTNSFTVTAEDAGKRLDKLVAERAELGRRRVAEIFASGSVRVGGKRVVKGEPARVGDEVVVEIAIDDRPKPETNAPLEVRFETRELVVVSKPAGQPSAPLRGESGTLAGALLARYPEMEEVGHSPREPGLLHRLDTQTSGLVVAARTREAFQGLHRALREGEMQKRYLAIVEGKGLEESGSIEAPIGPDRRNPRRVLVGEIALGDSRRPLRNAVTRFRVIGHDQQWALLELDVSRAFRHQIRAHLASIGHPIAGDAVYGGTSVPELGTRHALHASYVGWAGDESIPGFAVTEPLPDDLAILMPGLAR